jgi:hypothetical protein
MGHLMTIRVQEAERRHRQRIQSNLRQQSDKPHSDRVLTFRAWCELNSISVQTGRRILAAGKIRYVQLSVRRIGIRESDNTAYQASCLRGGE